MSEIFEVEIDDNEKENEKEDEFERIKEVARNNLVGYALRMAEMVQRYAQFRCRVLISEGITLGYNSRVDVVPLGDGAKIVITIEYEIPGWLVEQVARQWAKMSRVFVKKWRHARQVDRRSYGREVADNTLPWYRSRKLIMEEGGGGGNNIGMGFEGTEKGERENGHASRGDSNPGS